MLHSATNVTNVKVIAIDMDVNDNGYYYQKAGTHVNKVALLGLAVATHATAVNANDTDTDSLKGIEQISVVGAATNLNIDAEDLENIQANDLSDVFRLSPSVSVGGSIGIAQKVYIRGLEDSMLNVTVDGAQQTSTLFHHIGRVNIDPDLLERIEIQAGAGEATSGPGAIGGSIRFKTKDANDLLADDEVFGGRLKANYFSNDGTRYSGTVYGRLSDDWGVLGYYSDVDRENMEDGNGDPILGSAADQTMLFVKASGSIGENQYLSVSAERRDEEGAFSARPNWIVQEGDALYPSDAERITYVANYHINHSELVNIEATAYSTSSSFRGGRFDWLAEIDTFGFDLRNSSDFGDHTFIYGVDYRSDKVDSGYAIPQPEEDHAEEGSVTGLYAQGYSDITPQLLVSYGVRVDDYSYEQKILLDDYYGDVITDVPATLDDTEVSINLGLSYTVNEFWTLGLGYAEAARGKQIGDGFTLDSYLYDRTENPVVNDDLKPETVANIEASVEYSGENLSAKFAVFQSALDDVIFDGANATSVYNNIGTIDSDGIEFDVAYRWNDLNLFFGVSTVDAELDPRDGLYAADYSSVPLNSYAFNALGNSRGDTFVLGAEYELSENIQFGANVTRVSSLTIETLHSDLDQGWVDALYQLNKPGYTTVDAFVKWQVTDSVLVNLAVTNLFEKLYRDHSSVGDYSGVPGYGIVVGPNEAGRDIRLSVSFDF